MVYCNADNVKEKINVLRGIAIFSVVCAHTAISTNVNEISIKCVEIMQIFGCGGVGLFFVLSGYFFAENTDDIQVFWRKKLYTLIIPWFVTGTIVYLYTEIRKTGVSLRGWIQWICGIRTYLWYMMVLFILFVVFKVANRCKILLKIIPIISIVSFCSYKILYPYLWSWGGDYLNFFNWQLFFWVGYQINTNDKLKQSISNIINKKILFIGAYLICLSVLIILGIDMHYRTPFYIIYELLFIFSALACSELLIKNFFIKRIGRHSFSIYLIHMPVAGVINYIVSILGDMWMFVLLKPIVVLFCVELLIILYTKCISKTGNYENILKRILGLR